MAAEADCTIDPFPAGTAVQDRVPVRRDGVQSPVAAPAVAALHGGVAPAQALPYLWQPIPVCRLVVAIRVDRVLYLLAGNAAGVKHFTMGGLEVETLHEVAGDRAGDTEIR